MGLLDVLSEARAATEDHGPRAGLLRLWLAGRRVSELDLFALSEPHAPPRALEASEDHTFRFADREDLIEIGREHEDQYLPVDLEYLERGDRCLLQLDGDTLAGFAWIAGSQLVHIADGFHLNLPDHVIYNYHAFTAPEYRGNAFQALRHCKLLELLEPEGKTALFGFVDRLNFASQKGVVKSGYRKVGRVTLRHRSGSVTQTMKVEEDFWCGERRI